MHAGTSSLSEVGTRLRQERDRRDLNQADFGVMGGINRNTQALYESGKRPFDVQYLLNLIGNGVDSHYVLTGEREIATLSERQSAILNAFDAMTRLDQAALLRLSCSITSQPAPAEAITLPSTAALADAFGGLLEASPGLAGAELAHELAKRLPIILRSAEDEIPTAQSRSHDGLAELLADRDDDRRAGQRGQRT